MSQISLASCKKIILTILQSIWQWPIKLPISPNPQNTPSKIATILLYPNARSGYTETKNCTQTTQRRCQMKDNKLLKYLILAVLVIYVVSPVDLLPGPVDDVIAILLYLASNKNSLPIGKRNNDIEAIDTDGREI